MGLMIYVFLFDLLQLITTVFYPLAIAFGAEALVSIERIEEFLLKPERDDSTYRLVRKELLPLKVKDRKQYRRPWQPQFMRFM